MATAKRTRKSKSATSSSKIATAPVKTISVSAADVQDAIRVCAYSLYEQRGHEHGHDLDDWLRAEVQVRSQLNS